MADLNAEISEDLKARFDMACAARRVSKKNAVAEALEAWIHPGDGMNAKSTNVMKLETIESSGDEVAISAVTQNIDLFHDRLRPAPKKSARKRTGT